MLGYGISLGTYISGFTLEIFKRIKQRQPDISILFSKRPDILSFSCLHIIISFNYLLLMQTAIRFGPICQRFDICIF